MSIEMSVLSDRRLTSTAEWQRAIDAEGFPLKLDPGVALEKISGFLPGYFGDKLTGFECHHDDPVEFFQSHADSDFGRRWSHVLGLRIIGNYAEQRAVWMAATAYARATEGVVWDGESGEVMSPDRAAEVARKIDRTAPRE
jgi:hypothetical protein